MCHFWISTKKEDYGNHSRVALEFKTLLYYQQINHVTTTQLLEIRTLIYVR